MLPQNPCERMQAVVPVLSPHWPLGAEAQACCPVPQNVSTLSTPRPIWGTGPTIHSLACQVGCYTLSSIPYPPCLNSTINIALDISLSPPSSSSSSHKHALLTINSPDTWKSKGNSKWLIAYSWNLIATALYIQTKQYNVFSYF